jgi:hypothetical protein
MIMPTDRVDQLSQKIIYDLGVELLYNWEAVGNLKYNLKFRIY